MAFGPLDLLKTCKLALGYEVATGRLIRLRAEHLATGIHILGPTGEGKTRLEVHLLLEILRRTPCNVVAIDPKGDFFDLALPAVVEAGFGRDLVLVDMEDPRVFAGYDPLRPNGLPIERQAKAAAEAIRCAWGATAFDATPLLRRYLFVALAAARALTVGLPGALELLRLESPRRALAVRALPSGYVRDELVELDQMPPSQRQQITQSTVGRLGAFLGDPKIARMVAERERVLDLDAILFGPQRRILLVNLASPAALANDDMRLLSRFLLNDLLTHRLMRRHDPQVRPTVLIAEEAGSLATDELVRALDWGRALGFWTILAHQHMAQLRQEGELLEHAVTTDARTKIVFGGVSVRDLEPLTKELFTEEWDPYEVKQEFRTLECEPHEERRQSSTRTRNWGTTTTRERGTSVTVQADHTRGTSESEMEAKTKSRGRHRAHVRHESDAEGYGTSDVASDAMVTGDSLVFPPGDGLFDVPDPIRGITTSHIYGGAHATQFTTAHVTGEAHGEGESKAVARTRGHATGTHQTTRVGLATGTSTSTAHGRQRGGAVSLQDSPWMAYRIRRPVTSREFVRYEEFLTRRLQDLRRQLRAHIALKVPGKPVRFLKVKRVRSPTPSAAGLLRTRERIYAQPYYRVRDPAVPEGLARPPEPRVVPPPPRRPRRPRRGP